jgi:hypothetical protein
MGMLHQLLDTTGLFFASRLRLSNHSSRQSHQRCTANEYYANHVDDSTYQTKHTIECQGCEHVQINVEKVADILKQGSIPLVAITPVHADGGHTGIELEVITSAPYVAISHV